MAAHEYVSIAVIAPLEGPLTYLIPQSLLKKIIPGQRVSVPLGRRRAVGVVLNRETSPPPSPCKEIEAILDEEPAFTPLQLEFLKWASDYYLAPLGEMIRNALPAALTRILQKKSKNKVRNDSSAQPPPTQREPLSLTPAQTEIVERIFTELKKSPFSVHLIHGVTGSGKTEVYMECIRRRIQEGRQALCLVPEIGLTPQTLDRYTRRFGPDVGIYHSGLSDAERRDTWEKCRRGTLKLLVGTRSALFAPFPNLGLIVVDEEQDASYKQEERARYHARDLAIVRAKMENIPVLLGSATPSVESYWKARNGKFRYHEILDRFGEAKLPAVEVVDLRWKKEEGDEDEKTAPSAFPLLSPRLLEEIEKNLTRDEQTLIFLNRRGFSHFLLCEDCGYTPTCPNCEITLTYHRKNHRLICHYCDHLEKSPETCPSCRATHWYFSGTGTERLEDELRAHFPEARIARMDRDTTSRKGSHRAILDRLKNRQIDLLVGTQMIAKGHDYPQVTLVGIVLADASLHHADFRAAERTFHLLTQVAGRAGRAEAPGRVLLQSFHPEHFALTTAAGHQTKEFYEQETALREELGYPPFRRLWVLRVQGAKQETVKEGVDRLKKRLEEMPPALLAGVDILGPSPCLVEKVRNLYRWQILMKSPMGRSLQPALKDILRTQRSWLPAGLRLVVDVDPVNVI